MWLYTICIQQRPAIVMNANNLSDVYKALDTWLGDDLRVLKHDGAALWMGDWKAIAIREAAIGEAKRWHASHREAANEHRIDAGASRLTYLVSVSNPTDRAFDENDGHL